MGHVRHYLPHPVSKEKSLMTFIREVLVIKVHSEINTENNWSKVPGGHESDPNGPDDGCVSMVSA